MELFHSAAFVHVLLRIALYCTTAFHERSYPNLPRDRASITCILVFSEYWPHASGDDMCEYPLTNCYVCFLHPCALLSCLCDHLTTSSYDKYGQWLYPHTQYKIDNSENYKPKAYTSRTKQEPKQTNKTSTTWKEAKFIQPLVSEGKET